MPRLKNWYITWHGAPYTPPEMGVPCLSGEVYDHPAQPDGKHVSTSEPVGYDAKRRLVLTRSGSAYRLLSRDVEPGYEAKFPNARRRFVRSLCRVQIDR